MNYLKVLSIALVLFTFGCVDDASDTEKYTKPTVNAGSDQLHTLPQASVTLRGSAKTYPKHLYKIKTTRWSQISGPQQLAILNGDSLTATLINPTIAGTYEFELYAKDSIGRTNTDRVKIILREQQVLVNARSTSTYLDDYQLMWDSVFHRFADQYDVEQQWHRIYQAYWVKAADVANESEWQQLIDTLKREMASEHNQRGQPVGDDQPTFVVDWSSENGIATVTLIEPNQVTPTELRKAIDSLWAALTDSYEVHINVISSSPLTEQIRWTLMESFAQQTMDLCLLDGEKSNSCVTVNANKRLEGKRLFASDTSRDSVLSRFLLASQNGESRLVISPTVTQEIERFRH